MIRAGPSDTDPSGSLRVGYFALPQDDKMGDARRKLDWWQRIC